MKKEKVEGRPGYFENGNVYMVVSWRGKLMAEDLLPRTEDLREWKSEKCLSLPGCKVDIMMTHS